MPFVLKTYYIDYILCVYSYYSNEFSETLQAFASGRNIKVEISRVEIEIECKCKCTEYWMPPVPIKEMKIYGPR